MREFHFCTLLQKYGILETDTHTFIQRVVAEMIKSTGGDFSSTLLILPSRRPYAFFRKEFAQQCPKPFLLPGFITMHEWMQSTVPQRVIGKDEAVLMFYQYYLKMEGDQAQSFDQFYSWATGVLADFNEVDKYLVNPEQLFINLRNVKDIENWSFSAPNFSKGQQEFMTLWDKLPEYYTGFNQFLTQQGLCTDGYAYRYMAQHISEYGERNKSLKLFFAGLNALSASEEKSVFTLAKADRAIVWLEGHDGYVKPTYHEAGLFLRNYQSLGINSVNIHQYTQNNQQQVHVHECAGTVAQVITAVDILRKIKAEQRNERVAVVLGDESLLIPLLEELDKDAYNVTMGWPLIHSSWFKFLVALSAWPDQVSIKSAEKRMALAMVKQLAGHPLGQKVFDFTPEINKQIQSFTSYYVPQQTLETWFKNNPWLLQYLLSDKKTAGNYMLGFFTHCIQSYLHRTGGKASGSIEREILFHLLKVIDSLNLLPGLTSLQASNRLMRQLFISACRNQPLAFLGEPLEGVQIMGMLESRCLSFDEVIILSANEGVLPAPSFSGGMIPYDLRAGHGLPGVREKEAVFGYYFYRLVQNSKKANILFASGGEALNRLEKSRYILQLENEGEKLFNGMQVQSQVSTFKSTLTNNQLTEITNTPASIQKIKEWMSLGVSVSALDKFIKCPRDFYYRYIAGLQEPDSPEEWADDASYGVLVHDTLQNLYTPFVGKEINPEELQNELKNLDVCLNQAIEKQKKCYDFTSGKNLLTTVAARSAVERFVQCEIRSVEDLNKQGQRMKLVSLEQTAEHDFSLEHNGETIPVKLKGRIDRVHAIGHKTFIVDYKTGRVDAEKDLRLKPEVFEKWTKINSKLLQLLFYQVLTSNQFTPGNIVSGIFSLRNSELGLSTIESEISAEEIKESTQQLLTTILTSILSPQTEFIHSPEAKYCEFC